MNENLPIPITNENDLSFYQDYLNHEFEQINPKNYLNEFLGCLVKIETIPQNTNCQKIGTLENIGEDFITIKLQNKNKTIIAIKYIKFITILQNKTKSPYF